jgi:hypothetical protein
LAWAVGRAGLGVREGRTVAAAALVVAGIAVVLWLVSGVRLDEIARYLGYELGFVFLPGWLVYRAVAPRPHGRLRELVFGWSLGYFLEILAFYLVAEGGDRSAFYVYPVVVGVPAALIIRRRKAVSRAERVHEPLPVRWIWIGAALCVLLLLYAGAVAFTQTPLPRDVGAAGATYQEDTVFAISLAAEALHHWPMTLPMVAGEPLHYHLFAFMHMAAISQVTGIDLSVVVMRLYELPLLVLFALQLFLVGRRVARSAAAGLVAMFAVLFLGELDISSGTGVSRFLFRGLSFYWLLASHTFLLGLVFFLPALVLLCDLLTGGSAPWRRRAAEWALLTAFLVGCVGSKSYSVLVLGGGLGIFVVGQLVRSRTINRAALAGLGLSAGVYVAANVLVFGWNSAGASIRAARTIKTAPGVEDLFTYFGYLWGTSHVPTVLLVAFGTFGLLGVPIVGIALLLRYRRFALSPPEALFLSLFAAALPILFFSSQPGFGQLFLVFFGVVPGTILAANGYRLWLRDDRPLLRPTALVLVAAAASVLVIDLVARASPRVGLEVTLFWIALAVALGLVVATRSRTLALRVGIGVGALGLLVLDTPVIRLVRSALGRTALFSLGTAAAAAALAVGLAVLAAGTLYVARRSSVRQGLAAGAVAATLVLAVLDVPLDWFPHLIGNTVAGKAVYSRENRGLTAGLYQGLTWVRGHTDPNAVLVVNNHSAWPDSRDSKYFYYSAFAERRVVLESWDYTEETTRRGFFSLPSWLTPFPQRLQLSDAVFRHADEIAIRTLARSYGARYLLADKIHGPNSPFLGSKVQRVFSNGDLDVYAIGRRPPSAGCPSEQGTGIAAVFGHRRTVDAADALRRSAEGAGFPGLVIQQRGCRNYAVVLTGLENEHQAREFQREAATVHFRVRLECRSRLPQGGLNAVFGHRRTQHAAQVLATRAQAAGFLGLDVQQDRCGDWEVDLAGLKTAAQRRDFRHEAESVGFHVTFERG